MQFGHFDDAKKEYVITSPKTPLPWINYLGSENFFSLISNTCGGYSFYKDAKLLRLTRYRYNDTPLDQNGRYYYIKDGDTVWNPGWQPTQTPLDSYECHHGLGYSRFVSSKNLVAAELTAFVPLADSCEVNRLMLTNNGTEEKTLALTSFVEFCFWNAVDDMTNFQRNFSIGEVEIQGSEIYHKTEYRERRRHYAVYAVNCPIDGYDTDRDAFLGAYRGNDRPETVLRGTAGNTVASGWGVIGSHHIDVTLKPGESRSFIFVLGYCENAADDKWEAPGVINKKPAKEMPKEEKPVKEEIPEISIIREGQQEPTVYKEELETKFGKGKKEKQEAKTAAAEKKEPPKPEKKTSVSAMAEPAQKPVEPNTKSQPASSQDSEYQFPSLDLLSKPKKGSGGQSDSDLLQTAKKLQDTLDSFGVKVKMGDVSCGPSVTRYELVPEQGVKVNSITRLADDIKLSLAASDIRIEAPIPGKAAVGIEVPNAKRNTVTLRELLESPEFINAKSNVTFAVGKDIGGKTIVTDIAKMPHMLIAGATGSGKSVCINTLIMSILYKANPNDVKFIMVDPKMVELTAYADIPHMLIPVVTDPKKASAALNWAVQEMTVRYEKFAALGVRDIKSYNKKIAGLKHNDDNTYEKMCQIVIVVDEFADLMMVASNEVEDAVCRLAQLARAAGIHLVLATQRPSVNVITGLIKANMPSRIAFAVTSGIDSRTILDMNGAEKLLGKGDMLFFPSGYPKPVRVQGAFVSDDEVSRVVDFLKENSQEVVYDEAVSESITSTQSQNAHNTASEKDSYFAEAGRFIIEKEKGSIGMLQRYYKIGFNRAARIMDQLADAGVVGPEVGTKPRKVLMTPEEFETYLKQNT